MQLVGEYFGRCAVCVNKSECAITHVYSVTTLSNADIWWLGCAKSSLGGWLRVVPNRKSPNLFYY